MENTENTVETEQVAMENVAPAEEVKEEAEVCPECGKNPCECEKHEEEACGEEEKECKCEEEKPGDEECCEADAEKDEDGDEDDDNDDEPEDKEKECGVGFEEKYNELNAQFEAKVQELSELQARFEQLSTENSDLKAKFEEVSQKLSAYEKADFMKQVDAFLHTEELRLSEEQYNDFYSKCESGEIADFSELKTRVAVATIESILGQKKEEQHFEAPVSAPDTTSAFEGTKDKKKVNTDKWSTLHDYIGKEDK